MMNKYTKCSSNSKHSVIFVGDFMDIILIIFVIRQSTDEVDPIYLYTVQELC